MLLNIYIHNSSSSINCQPLSDLGIQESVWCLVTLNRTDTLLVGLIYRSPNSTVENNNKILYRLFVTYVSAEVFTLTFSLFSDPYYFTLC